MSIELRMSQLLYVTGCDLHHISFAVYAFFLILALLLFPSTIGINPLNKQGHYQFIAAHDSFTQCLTS